MRHRYGSASVALAAVVLVLGILATAGVTAALATKERHSADLAMDRQVELAQAAVSGEVRRYLDTIDNVAAALGSHDVLGPDAFSRATARVPGEDLAGATALVFVVPAAPEADLGQLERTWRAAGATDLSLRPAGTTEHLFAIYGRQLDGLSTMAGGRDFAADAEAADVLHEARRIDRAAVSNASLLALDTGRPVAERRRELSLATPVRTPAGQLRGWVLLGLRGQGFFGGSIGEVLQSRVTATLSAPRGATSGGGLLPIATVNRTAPPGDALHRGTDVAIAQRSWRLDIAADPHELPGAYTDRPLLAGLTGVALSLMLTALVYLLSTRRAKAMVLVEAATRELRAAEREARDQAALQQAILASVGEGVTVVDAGGRMLLHNPAARALLGTADDAVNLEDWPAHYGAYLPDRVTPFPARDMPMTRALRGAAADRVEMVIRNPAHPDGILVSVSARPLDRSGGGPRGAVAVLHDITELRRYETELAQFAAVVAHDLKSPLTAVYGFAAVAADALRGPAPRVETAGTAVERVRQGATRMRAIIDDLLAYTTARDAPLHLTEVDLGDLVAAVVAERTAARAARGDGVEPVIRVGPMPVVRADPGLLRLVVDNLIGNAIKYTPAGLPARVEIGARTDHAGLLLEVADRGIGIPDSEKARVFESFYRARPVDYGGTGLGLAICRRIVERHGGSIAVEDNPGGGTRFCVHLPAPVLPGAADRSDSADSSVTGWEPLRGPAATLGSSRLSTVSPGFGGNHNVK